MQINGINHLCFSVSDLERSIAFYQNVLDAELLVVGRKLAYFDLNGLWIALNEETDISREHTNDSYTHIALSIEEADYEQWLAKLKRLGVSVLPGRNREIEDRKSIYFIDPDGHKLELHTGTLQARMEHYRNTKLHMKFIN